MGHFLKRLFCEHVWNNWYVDDEGMFTKTPDYSKRAVRVWECYKCHKQRRVTYLPIPKLPEIPADRIPPPPPMKPPREEHYCHNDFGGVMCQVCGGDLDWCEGGHPTRRGEKCPCGEPAQAREGPHWFALTIRSADVFTFKISTPERRCLELLARGEITSSKAAEWMRAYVNEGRIEPLPDDCGRPIPPHRSGGGGYIGPKCRHGHAEGWCDDCNEETTHG